MIAGGCIEDQQYNNNNNYYYNNNNNNNNNRRWLLQKLFNIDSRYSKIIDKYFFILKVLII